MNLEPIFNKQTPMVNPVDEFNKVLKDVFRLLGVGLFLMYLILGTQFKSFLQPLMM